MKGAIRNSFWLLGVVALVLCCTPAFADSQFALTSTSGSLWGVYTSPYGTNNAAVGTVICDDFKDDSYMNQNYTYKNESFSTLIAQGNGIWNGTWGVQGSTFYEAAAYMVLQVYSSSGINQQYLNWAVWALFDPTDALAVMNANGVNQAGCNTIFGAGAWNGSKCLGGNGGLIGTALANGGADFLAGAFNNLVVYIPQNNQLNGWCNSPGACESQEFFGEVPEGGSSALYLLLAGVSCVGAMIYSRRQTARAGTA
jgi:hypothetical protein